MKEFDFLLGKCAAASLDVLSSIFGDHLLPVLLPILHEALQHQDWQVRRKCLWNSFLIWYRFSYGTIKYESEINSVESWHLLLKDDFVCHETLIKFFSKLESLILWAFRFENREFWHLARLLKVAWKESNHIYRNWYHSWWKRYRLGY